jgi:hypothetical protein
MLVIRQHTAADHHTASHLRPAKGTFHRIFATIE